METNSLKKIVTKLVNKFTLLTNKYFVCGSYETLGWDKYDFPAITKVKAEIYSIDLHITLTATHDDGSDVWSVYKFELNNNSVYVKFVGSFNDPDYGMNFDEWFFVKEKEVTVTVFERDL